MRIHADNAISSIKALFLLAIARVAIGTSVTISGTQSTCPARSINYITQTLPQQCFTSSWASKPGVQSTTRDSATQTPDTSTSVLTVQAPPTGSIDSSLTLTTHVESSSTELNASPNVSEHDAAPTATSPRASEGAKQSGESIQETDLDSPLDNSKFLSFEEWKHQNLAKAGQSAESLGKRQEGVGSEHGRRPASINNALETFGDDNEIDIDFSGFVNAGGMNEALPVQSSLPVRSTSGETETPKESGEDLSNTHKRNKDAGKTCNERSNYASFDCAATVLKTNPECKSATSVLVESKDSYMLNVCSADNKFFIVELCDDILVDTIVLANFEYFSSMFRTFRVSVSDRYPAKMDRWKELGTFEARNSRAIQAFLIENPLIWARYLRVELLTHFGVEYYCPVSLLRVHGTTMMEEFNHEVKGLRPEDEAEDEAEDIKSEAPLQQPIIAHTEVVSPVAGTIDSPVPTAMSTAAAAEVSPNTVLSKATSANSESLSLATKGSTPHRASIAKGLEDILFCKNDRVGRCSYINQLPESESTSSSTLSSKSEKPTLIEEKPNAQIEDEEVSEQTRRNSKDASMVTHAVPPNPSQSSHNPIKQNVTSLPTNTSTPAMENSISTSADDNSASGVASSAAVSARNASSSSATIPAIHPSKANSTHIVKSSTQKFSVSTGSSSAPSMSPHSSTSSPTTSVKNPSSSTQPPSGNPSTQESFFKSVHKRLQQLEANSTLSLQYIEEQSRILRDAFSSVEKRQLSKTSTFLESLNTTVLTELRDFRTQYDQIWQSTVLELSSQREQSAQQVSVLSARMTFLADEIVFQKRVAMVQFMLILLCLGLVVFSRSGRASTYLDLPPLVHNAIKRSSANLARYTHFETPPASPSSSRPPSQGLSSKYGLFHRKSHRRTLSDESDANGGIQSPIIAYSPPSPVSQISREDREASPGRPFADELDNMSFT